MGLDRAATALPDGLLLELVRCQMPLPGLPMWLMGNHIERLFPPETGDRASSGAKAA